MVKIGRNEKCPCGSGKKYKKCCVAKDFIERQNYREKVIYGDEFVSKYTENTAKALITKYPDHQVIDVSKVLSNEQNYRDVQMQHYLAKTIMVVERNEINDELFESRCPDHINHMVLYRGAYQCFDGDDCDDQEIANDILETSDIYKLIDTRLEDEVWEDN